jgi:ParB family chromosome partitioning protein
MPRRASPPVEIRRGQGGRPQPPREAAAQRDSERALPGALTVPIEQIAPDPDQPRKEMDPIRLGELAASLREYGVLQPLLVREDGTLDDGRTRYMIVAGGRRYAAAQQAGLTRLPVLVRDSEAVQARILQLTENIQREALDPVEEARALKELMDLRHMGSRAMAEHLHCSHAYVNNRLKLIAHEDVAAALQPHDPARGALSPSVALEIAREEDPALRRRLIERARTERLRKEDVRQIRRYQRASDLPETQPVGGTPTLREVADHMGATQDHVRAAAQARREEPELTPAEALALAMHAPTTTPVDERTQEEREDGARDRSRAPDETLLRLLGTADEAHRLLRVLSWARTHALTLDQLDEQVRAAHAYLAP